MLIHGKHRILQEAINEFQWIVHSKMKKDDKLYELVNLRNYLYSNFLLNPLDGCEEFIGNVQAVVKEIDEHWWLLFTGKKVS